MCKCFAYRMSVQPCACLVLVEDRKGEASLKNKTNNNNKNPVLWSPHENCRGNMRVGAEWAQSVRGCSEVFGGRLREGRGQP